MNWFIKYIFPVIMIGALLLMMPVPNSFGAKYRIGPDSDLKSPPAIGSTTPNTGTFTDLTVNGTGTLNDMSVSGTADFVGVIHGSSIVADTITLGGIPLSAWPSSGNAAGVAQNASDIFLNYLYDQERHGIDSQNMEEGFVGVFATTANVVVNEAKSTGEEYDTVNKLYKPLSGGINQDSDKTYTTESNYLQQEWDKNNNGEGGTTSQATVSGTSVSISPGTSPNGEFPTNCAKGRISFDSGSTWFDIDSRDSDTQLTLSSSATNGTFDYIIRMSEFDSGVVKLNEAGGGASYGPNLATGATVTHNTIINSGPISNAADGNTSTKVNFDSNDPLTALGKHVRFEFTSGAVTITKVRISVEGAEGRSDNVDFTIDGSSDGTNWNQIYFRTGYYFQNGTAYDDFTFTNNTAYTYYRINFTKNGNSNNGIPSWYDTQMMEANAAVPANEYVSIVDTEAEKVETSSWSDINLSTIDETPDTQNIYYWLIFDPASGYGSGTEVKVFDQTDSSWRLIAKNDGSTWKYNSAVSGSETLTTSTVNDMLHAISEAVKLQAANRMTHDDYEDIEDIEWQATGGFTTSVGNIIRGLTLHSASANANPSVDRFGINYDGENAALDLWTDAFSVSSAPTETYTFVADKHISASPTYYVTRDCDAGTPDWTDITDDMEVSTTLSDGRSVRRATKDLSATASGTKLCFRVTVPTGSEYEISAVGQQARE